jgi:hypothetical protein
MGETLPVMDLKYDGLDKLSERGRVQTLVIRQDPHEQLSPEEY